MASSAFAAPDAQPSAAHPASTTPARIGPNAVIQLRHALHAEGGDVLARDVFRRAGVEEWLTTPPAEMVSEADVARLYAVLYAHLERPQAARVATDAGQRTADYILAHRIPSFAQAVLKALPSRLAAPLLLKAIAANAWTFVGSGAVRVAARPRPTIDITDNPIRTPDCVWHASVFARLFTTLVAQHATVAHAHHLDDAGRVCRFTIDVARRAAGGGA